MPCRESDASRDLCGDVALASEMLERLSAREHAERDAALVSGYNSVVADLEREIAEAMEAANEHG